MCYVCGCGYLYSASHKFRFFRVVPVPRAAGGCTGGGTYGGLTGSRKAATAMPYALVRRHSTALDIRRSVSTVDSSVSSRAVSSPQFAPSPRPLPEPDGAPPEADAPAADASTPPAVDAPLPPDAPTSSAAAASTPPVVDAAPPLAAVVSTPPAARFLVFDPRFKFGGEATSQPAPDTTSAPAPRPVLPRASTAGPVARCAPPQTSRSRGSVRWRRGAPRRA